MMIPNPSPLVLASALAAALAVVPAAAQATYTVDDDDPNADFQSLSAAVAAAASGDRILVEPGNYLEQVSIDKSLSILGRPGFFYPSIGVVTVSDVESIVLLHLGPARLELTGITGRAVVDDCVLPGDGAVGPATLEVVDCADLRVNNTRVQPKSTDADVGSDGVRVAGASRVTFVGCELRGGDTGFQPTIPSQGGVGLQVSGGAELLLAGSRVVGGTAYDFSTLQGTGGVGLVAEDAATLVEVRGSSFDGIFGGFSGEPLFNDRAASTVIEGATVVLSGTGFNQPSDPDLVVVADRPYLEVLGSAALGAQRSPVAVGPAGAPAVIVLGLPAYEPAFAPVLGLAVGVDLGGPLITFNATLVGQDLPAGPLLLNPADANLAGLWLEAQALVVDGGALLATNSAPLLLGF